jgi:ribosomal protein L22/predicted transcriptional regulator
MDLFEELESYEEKTATPQEPRVRGPARELAEAGAPKRVMAKEPKIRGSPRRLAIMSSLLVGKSYLELMQLLPRLHNTGARSAERAVENAKKRAHQMWDVESDHRLVVEQAWVGKGEVAPRVKFHARGRTGIMHRRWGKMWVQMRYIAPEDDEATFQKMSDALQRAGVEKHKVRYLLRYGPRTTVFRVSKEAGMTRQQGRSYLKMLSNTRPEFRRLPFDNKKKAAVVAEQQ